MSGGPGPTAPTPDSRTRELFEWADTPQARAPSRPSPPPPGPSPAAPRSWVSTRVVEPLTRSDRFSWLLAILLCAGISGAISYVMHSNPIVPGGDPGTWFATGYAFLNPNHPSQSVPLAYPPILFPILGVTAEVAGGPIAGAQIFAPVLFFVVGLSIFFLATQMLRSRLVALVATGFLMLDPQLIQMLYWGAYPNLLAFVFLYMALAGLILIGRGKVSRGAACFWAFALLTVLTHSLTGLLLASTTFFILLLSWPIAVPTRAELAAQSAAGEVDAPGVIRRGLFFSKGGKIGLVVFAAIVAAYYVVTALAHVPHPSYFVSNPIAFQVVGLGGFFHSLFPGFNLLSLIVVDLLAVAIIAILLFYAILVLHRPRWLTTPLIILIGSGIAITLTPVVGWMFRIVSDYTRFGFFLIVPVGLSFAYLIDRGWVSARTPPKTPAAPIRTSSSTLRRWLGETRHPRRAVAFAAVSFVVGLLLAVAVTGPSLWRLETEFTQVGHDQEFVDALNAIDATGHPGSILTVPGADKWARAISNRNAYAPYTQATYLFYQSQILDSDLSYYALMSHFAITNGLVSATVRGVEAGNVNGTPGFGVYIVGAYHPVLQVAGQNITAILLNTVQGTPFQVNFTASTPYVTLPTVDGAPMEIVLNSTGVQVQIFAIPTPGDPQMQLIFNAVATGADPILSVSIPLVAAVYTGAAASLTSDPGQFAWRTWSATGVRGPLTIGNVTPQSAISSVGGAFNPSSGVGLTFRAPSASMGARLIVGSMTLWTATGSTLDNVLPPNLDTPAIWQELDIGFILMRNGTFGTTQTVSSIGEIPYLETEFDCVPIYANPEWTVLQVPANE